MSGGLSLAALPLAAQQPAQGATSDQARPRSGQMGSMGAGMDGMMGMQGMTGGPTMMGGRGMMAGQGVMGMMGGQGMMRMMGGEGAMGMYGTAGMTGYAVTMQALRFSPARLLAAKDALELTGDQVNPLEKLQPDSATLTKEAQTLGDAQQELQQAMTREPVNRAAIQQATQNVATVQAGIVGGWLANAAAARAVLAPAQRDKVQTQAPCGMQQGGGSGMQPGQHRQHHPGSSGGER